MDKICSAKELDRSDLIHVVKNAPLVSIDLIIKNDRNEILLGKRKNSPAKELWFVPGGRIKKCENLNNAFIRITKNELGKAFKENDARFLGVYTHKYNDNFAQEEGFGTHYVVLAYVLELNTSLNLVNLPKKQHDQYRWFKEDVIQQDTKIHQYVKDYCPIPPVSDDLGLYRSLMTHYCHYDRQMWSRTQILLAIQGAAFIPNFASIKKVKDKI